MGCWARRFVLRCPLPGPLAPLWKLLETNGAFPTEMGSQPQLRDKMRQGVGGIPGEMRNTPTSRFPHFLPCACASRLATGERVRAEGGPRPLPRPRPQVGPFLCGPRGTAIPFSVAQKQTEARTEEARYRELGGRHGRGGRRWVSPAAEAGTHHEVLASAPQ